MKVVLDCANGASYYVAPIVMRELGAEVICDGVKPNGLNINDGCGALHPENMCRLVKEHGADIGVSFDGDADRVQFCDHNGNIINCDRIIGLCALDYKSRGQLNNNAVAVTTTSNLGLHDAMREAGIRVEVTNVGDRYVIERMREQSLNLGGEQTGHLIFLEHSPTGDGLISALHVMRIMKKTGKSIAELSSFMREYPQLQSSLKIAERVPFDDLPELSKCIREAKQALGDAGRVIVRYSGTENKIRILAEAREESAARLWHDKLAAAAARELEVIP
jgi:phosphoglucosamine mutase